MADGDCAAVDVRLGADRLYLRGILFSKQYRGGEGHNSEGFVDLNDIHLVDRHAGFGKHLLRGEGRNCRDVFGVSRGLGVGYDRRQRLQPAARRFAFAHEHERAGSSVKSGGVARGDGRALVDGLELREPFKRRVGARRLIFGDHDVALFGVKDVGLYLVLEFTGLEGLLVEHLAAVGPFVLHFAADAVLESDLSRLLRARFTGVGA